MQGYRERSGRRKRHAKRHRKQRKPALPPSPPAAPQEKTPGVLGTGSARTGSIFGGGPNRPGLWNLHLIHQAVREGWDVPDELRLPIVAHISACMEHAKSRAKILAMRIILAMNRVNRRLERPKPRDSLRKLARRMAELQSRMEMLQPADFRQPSPKDSSDA
jgi:hypothetical protein